MAGLAVAAVGAVACGGSAAPESVPTLLASARRTVNAAKAVHFVLSSQNMPSSGSTLQGGTGDLVRPGELKGSFQASVEGLPVNIRLTEAGGKFYALLPFASHYQVVDPARFGLGDPAALLNPHTGVSGLLTELRGARSAGRSRFNGELLDQVSGSVPGNDVKSFLPDVDTSQPVALTFGIDPSSFQVRTVVAVGPFVQASVKSTYRVVLSQYGESVTVSAPSA